MRPPLDKMDAWTDFDGHYEKHECDVMLKDGTVITKCWPNGGTFTEIGGEKRVIDTKDIAKLRYHDYFSSLKH